MITNDLNTNYGESFYMTDEQIKKSKINKEPAVVKKLKKFFMGCAISVIGKSALKALALAASPALAATYAACVGTPIVGSVFAMNRFSKTKKGSDIIKDNIIKENIGGKHR